MFKRDEIAEPESCLNKARDHEMIFVLLARDAAAPAAIRAWIMERVRLGLNRDGDAQIDEAIKCVIRMETKFHCSRCGWEGPYMKASKSDTEPPECPICG